jgi:hypothetical protein
MPRRVVAVIGAAEPSESERRLAERVGTLVAGAGWVLISGGLGGVMAAASAGAAAAGGLVVGVVPHADPATCNPSVAISIATGMGDARNAILANTAAGFIAVGGSFGTLSEIAFALKRNKPVIGLSTWKLDGARAGTAPWIEVETAEDAVAALQRALARA